MSFYYYVIAYLVIGLLIGSYIFYDELKTRGSIRLSEIRYVLIIMVIWPFVMLVYTGDFFKWLGNIEITIKKK